MKLEQSFGILGCISIVHPLYYPSRSRIIINQESLLKEKIYHLSLGMGNGAHGGSRRPLIVTDRLLNFYVCIFCWIGSFGSMLFSTFLLILDQAGRAFWKVCTRIVQCGENYANGSILQEMEIQLVGHILKESFLYFALGA